MIFELIIGVFCAIGKGIAALFGNLPAPGWLLDAGGLWNQAMQVGAGLDAWIPWPLLVTVTLAVFACLATSFGIKVVRLVLSLFTGGGGSAA